MLETLHPVCAGIDVHRDSLTVCVATLPPSSRPRYETASFSTFADDLRSLADWLRQRHVPLVAMEGTGVYWMPVHAALESSCTVLIANAQHVKNVPGRKTDSADSRWLAQLLGAGLLAPSFVPPKDIRDLRLLSREHDELTRQRSALINRIHRLLDQQGNKLGSVVSDLQGTTAREVLRLLAAGETDTKKMTACARTTLRRRQADLTRALEQPLGEVVRGQLQRKLALWEELNRHLAEVDKRLSAHRQPYQAACDKMVEIPGIGPAIATKIIAEIGADMSVFETPQKLASWAGVCPGNHESAGKTKSGRTRKGNKYLKTALVEAAMAAARAKGTFLKEKYYQLRSRCGPKKAAMAVAHKLIKLVWLVLRDGETRYKEPGEGTRDKRHQERVERRLVQRLQALGHDVTLRPKPTTSADPAA